jgi:hypothetical protein
MDTNQKSLEGAVTELLSVTGQLTLVQHRFCKFVAAGLRGCVGRSDEGA